jgi:RNA polymerase sigma-70 factor (ECF subfamily)
VTSPLDRSLARHRRELHVHCYRMLGSFDEAEDAVQDALVRAWRAADTLTGDDNVRAWLYKIATNVCLDALRARSRRAPVLQSFADRLLDEIAPPEDEPDAVVVARETIALAYVAVIQLLPPRQRAVLILRDVLEWSAKETADMLEISVPAANSALQRARATLEQQPLPSTTGELGDAERDLLDRYVDAHQRADVAASLALAREDLRITMPPHPFLYDGIEQIRPLMAEGLTSHGEWRVLPTSANRMPAAACYLREPGGTEFRAFKLDVLRVVDGKVAEITTFDAALFDELGLPATV